MMASDAMATMNINSQQLKSAPSEPGTTRQQLKSKGLYNHHESNRAATKLPQAHFNSNSSWGQQARNSNMGEKKCANDTHVVGLDKNCMSCANTQNNEATLKAFKIACLSYQPSKVMFERTDYSRVELIGAK